jgi:serine/threonine protein phosphatase PrpC
MSQTRHKTKIEIKYPDNKVLIIPSYLDDFKETIQDGANEYGLCEIEGIRYGRQEDAMAVSSEAVSVMPLLDAETIQESYKTTFQVLQDKIASVRNMGATCCSATAWYEEGGEENRRNYHIVTANLGDAAAFFVAIDKDEVQTTKLTRDHIPINELERLIDFVPEPYRSNEGIADYINNNNRGKLPDPSGHHSLAVSRAFGDLNYESAGLIHEPEVEKFVFDLNENVSGYVVVACDGLTETALKTNDEIGEIIKTHSTESLEDMAYALVMAAYNDGKKGDNGWRGYPLGSTDNISVAIFRVGRVPASATVLDGHGHRHRLDKKDGYTASQLSKDIAQAFYPMLRARLEKALYQVFDPELLLSRTIKEVRLIDGMIKELNEIIEHPALLKIMKQALYRYEIQHAGKILEAQATLPHDDSDDTIVERLLLMHIRDYILSLNWEVSLGGGEVRRYCVIDDQGEATKIKLTLPSTVARMLDTIAEARQDEVNLSSLEEKQALWRETCITVFALPGEAAGKKKPSFLGVTFGGRAQSTQAFLELFLENPPLPLQNKSPTEKPKY